MEATLSPHPASPAAAVDRLTVTVERPSAGTLHLRYELEGRVDEIVVQAPAPPERADNLWRTTCFEAFLRPVNCASYLELNFSPSGRWAAYDFSAYRAGMVQLALPAAPRVTRTQTSGRLTVEILLSLEFGPGPYALGLAAVIEEKSGGKSFWAASHGGDAPDFHDASCFVHRLPPPAQA